MRLQRLYQLGNVEPHGGELLGRELQVDFLVLGAEKIDLRDVGNAEQLGSHALGIIAQLAVGEAIRGQREDQRIGIAELVVEEGTLHALWQGLFDVADLLSDLIPEIGHVRGAGGVLQIHEHHRLARLGVALLIVDVRQLFELLLDPIRDLLHRLQGGSPGPQRLHHHGLDGEGRVLVTPEPAIFKNTGEGDDQHQVDDEALMLQRPAGQIEGFHLLLTPGQVCFGKPNLLANRQGIHARGDDDVTFGQAAADDDGICLIARDRDGPQGETVRLLIKHPDSRRTILFK